MLFKDCIYGFIYFYFFCSFIVFIYSIRTKNRYILKIIKIIDIISTLLSFSMLFLIVSGAFHITYGLSTIFYGGLSVISLLLFTISFLICSVRRKKTHADIPSHKAKIILVLLLLLPTLILVFGYFKEKYFIDHSDFILIYHSSGNGGFGDGIDFAYAINDTYCKEISIGVDTNGYNMKQYLPKSFSEIDLEEMQTLSLEYEIGYYKEKKKIFIYKERNRIHEELLNRNYFNIELKRVFVRKTTN